MLCICIDECVVCIYRHCRLLLGRYITRHITSAMHVLIVIITNVIMMHHYTLHTRRTIHDTRDRLGESARLCGEPRHCVRRHPAPLHPPRGVRARPQQRRPRRPGDAEIVASRHVSRCSVGSTIDVIVVCAAVTLCCCCCCCCRRTVPFC